MNLTNYECLEDESGRKRYQTIFGDWQGKGKDREYVPRETPKTKQSFKDQCDINRILDKAKRTGVLSHVNRHAAFYGEDMSEFNYEQAQIEIAKTNSVFYELDANIRAEFGNDPGAFRQFVSQNSVEVISKKFPELAKPGKQLPDVVGGAVKTALTEIVGDALKKAEPTKEVVEKSDENPKAE